MYDVIIIGAGPAGNMAALTLAQAGFSIAVLDWRTDIGDKLCTGIIGRECAELFPLAPEHIHHQARSAVIVAPSGKRFRVERQTSQAYIVNRVAYVNAVAEQAKQVGAEYILGVRVNDIRTTNDAVNVAASSTDGQMSYRCKLLIIAAGFGSPLLRMVGLQDDAANEYLVGCQAEVSANDLEDTEVYLGSAISPHSFAWLVPHSNSRALAGMAPRRRINGLMDGFIHRLQTDGKIANIITKPRTWGIPIRPLPRTYADRVLVTGDAAGLVKPTTGGGIYYAFLSGRMAAQTAQTALAAGKHSAQQLRAYERSWKAALSKELRVSYYARMLFETLSDEQIDLLMYEFLSDEVLAEVIGDDVAFDWHSKVILKALRHTNARRILAALGPAAAPFVVRLLRMR